MDISHNPLRGELPRKEHDSESCLVQDILDVIDGHFKEFQPTNYRVITDAFINLCRDYVNNSGISSGCQDKPDLSKKSKIPAGFLAFWEKYPKARKYGKAQCQKKWNDRKLENISTEILAGLDNWLQSDAWTKDHGEFVPAPVVFINQSRWEASPPKKKLPEAKSHPVSDSIFKPRSMTAEDRAALYGEAWGTGGVN